MALRSLQIRRFLGNFRDEGVFAVAADRFEIFGWLLIGNIVLAVTAADRPGVGFGIDRR